MDFTTPNTLAEKAVKMSDIIGSNAAMQLKQATQDLAVTAGMLQLESVRCWFFIDKLTAHRSDLV